MSCCFNVTCFLCFFFLFIGITSLAQLCLGIYTTLVETDITSINYLIRTDKYDSYLFYILLAFVGLGFIALVLTLVSIYGISKRRRSLSLFVTILWVCSNHLIEKKEFIFVFSSGFYNHFESRDLCHLCSLLFSNSSSTFFVIIPFSSSTSIVNIERLTSHSIEIFLLWYCK